MSTKYLPLKNMANFSAGRDSAAGGLLKPWLADLFAVLATAATLGLRFALEDPLGGQPALVLFTLPIMLSAYLGGLRAGLVATATTYLVARYYLMPPVHSFAVASGDEGWLLFFVALAGGWISVLSETHHRGRRRAEIATGEQRQAVAALRESESVQLHLGAIQMATLNALPAQIALLDAQGGILSVNEAWRSATASALQGPEFCVGQNYLELCTRAPDDCRKEAEDAVRGIRQVLGGEANEFVLEYRCQSPEEQRWFRLMVTPLQESELAGAVVMHVNITEAKMAEAVQRRLAAIVHTSSDAIIGKTLEGIISSWNRGAEKMFGYSAAEAIGKPMLMTFPPELVEEEAAFLECIGRGESVEQFETVRVRKNGQRIDISATISPIKDGQGKIIGASKIARDITTQRRAEEALRQSQARLAGIVDSAMDAIITIDAEQRVLVFNAAAEKMFLCPAVEAIGGAIERFIPKRFHGGHAHQVQRFGEDGVTSRAMGKLGAISGVRSNGEEFPIEASISQITLAGRKLYTVIMRDITERVRAAAALREHEESFRTMANSIPQLAWMAHADGSIFWYNDRWYDYTGTTLEQMEGWGWQSVHDPEMLTRVMEQWTGAVAAGQTFEMEFPLRGADGEFRRFLTRAQPLRDSSGTVVQWFGTNTDVDELKRVEDSLRKSEASLAAAQSSAKIGNWELDFATQTGTWSAEMFRLFDREPALGVPSFTEFETMSHPDDRAALASLHAAAFNAGHAYTQDFRVIRPDGSIRWIALRGEVILDAAGKPVRMTSTSQDITKRKAADEEQARLLHILEQSLNEIFTFDATTLRFDFVNRAAQTNLHYSMEQLAAMTPLNLKPEYTLAQFREMLAPLESGEKPQQIFETVHRRADGSLYPVEVHLQLVNYRSRLVFLAMILDITKRKQGEEEILRLNAELEQRVAERTAQLEGANRELEAFSYSVSHDLRAPLRGVDGYVRMLMEDYGATMDAEGNRMLGVVSSEARRMGRLIDDLLAFSRMGRQKMGSTLIDMTSLVRGEFENLTHAAPASALRFDLQPLPPVEGDPAMLRQVFANLLANAIKFSRQQANPMIEVGSRSGEGEITFHVKDNGVGFDEKYGHKLFGVFQRLHSEEEFEGTGVGLALVQRVIHRHGGRVWAESKLKEGATFFFTLPTTSQNLP